MRKNPHILAISIKKNFAKKRKNIGKSIGKISKNNKNKYWRQGL